MKIAKSLDVKKGFYTKALKFLEGKKVKYIISYTVATNGKRWLDDDKKERLLGLFKKDDKSFVARALVVGKRKISFITVK